MRGLGLKVVLLLLVAVSVAALPSTSARYYYMPDVLNDESIVARVGEDVFYQLPLGRMYLVGDTVQELENCRLPCSFNKIAFLSDRVLITEMEDVWYLANHDTGWVPVVWGDGGCLIYDWDRWDEYRKGYLEVQRDQQGWIAGSSHARIPSFWVK